MKYEKRVNKDGSHYYSFVTSGRKRLTRQQIRDRFGKDILTEEEAEECRKQLEAKYEAEKLRIMNRLTWEQEYYNFSKLLDQYLVQQKRSAPNSWKNNEFYCKHYVLYYFLQVKRLNNIELWLEHFEDFREWLNTKAKTVRHVRPLAVSSQNHAIKALNTFLDHLYNKGIISSDKKCESFGEHLLNQRTIDDVVKPDEMEAVYARLRKLGYFLEAVYFRFLYFSGMRFNEGLCISLGDLFQGELESELMKKKMEAYSIKYHGYIVSDGQYGGLDSNRNVIRLPFKGKKTISEKLNRIIPIVDRVLWNELVEIAEAKHKTWKKGKDTRNCLLFESIDDATATRRLQEAFEAEKLKWRPWHCLRHSRATLLIGETGDIMLARLWLGHTSPKTIEKYNHIYQAIARAAKATSLTGKTFGLRRV